MNPNSVDILNLITSMKVGSYLSLFSFLYLIEIGSHSIVQARLKLINSSASVP